MKQKFIKITKSLLCGCMALSIWVGGGFPSLVLLGEYSYPQNEEE